MDRILVALPLTTETITMLVEDDITFQRRQFRWAAERLIREGVKSCTRSKLIVATHRQKNLLPEMLPEIDELVRKINDSASLN